jgi:hypothetical protein
MEGETLSLDIFLWCNMMIDCPLRPPLCLASRRGQPILHTNLRLGRFFRLNPPHPPPPPHPAESTAKVLSLRFNATRFCYPCIILSQPLLRIKADLSGNDFLNHLNPNQKHVFIEFVGIVLYSKSLLCFEDHLN